MHGNRLLLCVALTAWGLLCRAAVAHAGDEAQLYPVSDAMPDSGIATADPPPGYVGFCMRFQDQCDDARSGPATVVLTPARWRDILYVNWIFNRAIRPMADLEHYGRQEYWTIPRDGYGDCEDYALAKRASLIHGGFPAAALRIAVARLPNGEGHAVLTVITDQGDYVLDNRMDQVVSWRAMGYQWIERQDRTRTSGWVYLERPRDDVITADIAPAKDASLETGGDKAPAK